MKTTFFFIFTAILFTAPLASCQQRNCIVTNQQTGQPADDRNCDGIPDFQQNWNGGGGAAIGSIIFYGQGLVTNTPSTSMMGYYNDGNGFAIMKNQGSLVPREQWRLVSFKVWNGFSFQVRLAIADMSIAKDLKLAAAEIALTNQVVDAFDRKDVTAIQQYINNDKKVIVPQFVSIPESNPVQNSYGSDTYDLQTGRLNGTPIYYKIIGFEVQKVNQVFGIQPQ